MKITDQDRHVLYGADYIISGVDLTALRKNVSDDVELGWQNLPLGEGTSLTIETPQGVCLFKFSCDPRPTWRKLLG